LAPFSNIQPIPQLNCLSCLTYPQHTYQSDRKKQKYIFVGKTREISNNDGVKFLKDKEKASIICQSDRKKQKYIFVGKTREISNNDGVKFLKD